MSSCESKRCVCVCVWERERERVCVSVCVSVSVCVCCASSPQTAVVCPSYCGIPASDLPQCSTSCGSLSLAYTSKVPNCNDTSPECNAWIRYVPNIWPNCNQIFTLWCIWAPISATTNYDSGSFMIFGIHQKHHRVQTLGLPESVA